MLAGVLLLENFERKRYMAKNIYVGNLPFDYTEDQLHALFTAEGTVTKVHLIADRYTGQSRGFGFVEMSSDEEASAAIEKLNQSKINDRAITVNEARPREERKGGRGGFGGGGGGGGKRRGGGGGGGNRRW